MAAYIDPDTGMLVDDGTGDDGSFDPNGDLGAYGSDAVYGTDPTAGMYGNLDLYGAQGAPSGGFTMPTMLGDYNSKGVAQPIGQTILNRQLTGASNAMKLRYDPRMMYDAMVAT